MKVWCKNLEMKKFEKPWLFLLLLVRSNEKEKGVFADDKASVRSLANFGFKCTKVNSPIVRVRARFVLDSSCICFTSALNL